MVLTRRVDTSFGKCPRNIHDFMLVKGHVCELNQFSTQLHTRIPLFVCFCMYIPPYEAPHPRIFRNQASNRWLVPVLRHASGNDVSPPFMNPGFPVYLYYTPTWSSWPPLTSTTTMNSSDSISEPFAQSLYVLCLRWLCFGWKWGNLTLSLMIIGLLHWWVAAKLIGDALLILLSDFCGLSQLGASRHSLYSDM